MFCIFVKTFSLNVESSSFTSFQRVCVKEPVNS